MRPSDSPTPQRSGSFFLLTLALAALTALPAQAQQRTEPFSTVEFRISGTSNVNRNFLHEFWKRGTGVEVSLATPFYLGFLEFGGTIHRYEAEQDVPGFGAMWLYAGWGLGIEVANRLRLESSARIGNYRMTFDNAETEFAGVANESELAMMVNARVAVRAAGPVSVYVSGSYLQAYTFLRLKLWYASAGLSFRLQTPEGLKSFLHHRQRKRVGDDGECACGSSRGGSGLGLRLGQLPASLHLFTAQTVVRLSRIELSPANAGRIEELSPMMITRFQKERLQIADCRLRIVQQRTIQSKIQNPKSKIHSLPLVLLLLSLLAAGSLRAQPADPLPGVQIITDDDIAQAGLARLSDLFTLIDEWHATSTEGYAWEASANGLAATQETAWILLVDGNPVDLRILNMQNINTLPLSLGEIDYVEVHNTPTFLAGLFVQAGVLHLHTKTPAPGVTVRADFAAGNETGDPGPFRYTAFGSPNIDRIGPTLQGAASVAGDAWHLRIHGKADEHHATDERIRQRVLTFYQGEKDPRLILGSVGVDLGVTGRMGRHNVFGGFTRYQDLPFFEPVGLETPTDHRFYHGGLRGDFHPGKPSGMSYRLSYTVSQLEPRNNKGGVNFDWRQNTMRGHYEVRAATTRLRGALGLSADLIKSTAAGDLDDETLLIPRAYGRFGVQPNEYADISGTAYVTRVEGQPGYGALATVRITPDATQTITLTGSFARQPFQETNSLWYWIGEGYTFSARRDVNLLTPTSYRASTTYTADAAWRFRPDERFSLTLSGGYRRFDDRTLAAYTFQYDSLSTGFTTDTEVHNTVFGRVTKASAKVTFRIVPSLRQQLYYAYMRYPTQDDFFFQAWRSQPWHRFSYTVRFVPNPRFSLYGRLAYQSETQWIAFRTDRRGAQYGLWPGDEGQRKGDVSHRPIAQAAALLRLHALSNPGRLFFPGLAQPALASFQLHGALRPQPAL